MTRVTALQHKNRGVLLVLYIPITGSMKFLASGNINAIEPRSYARNYRNNLAGKQRQNYDNWFPGLFVGMFVSPRWGLKWTEFFMNKLTNF